MPLVITSGPIKPLTEVERAAALALRGEVEFDGVRFIRTWRVAKILEVEGSNIWNYAHMYSWRRRKVEAEGIPHFHRGIIYYAKDDVVQTAVKLKQKRK